MPEPSGPSRWASSAAPGTDSLIPSSPGDQTPIPNPFIFSTYLRLRKLSTLEEMRAELAEREESLNSDLVALVNQEYPSFLEVVAGLGGVERTLTPLADQWCTVRAPLETMADHIGQLLGQVEERLAHRQEVRQLKQTLQRMTHIHQSVNRIEAWLQELTEPGETSPTGGRRPSTPAPATPFSPPPITRSRTDDGPRARADLSPTGGSPTDSPHHHLLRLQLHRNRLGNRLLDPTTPRETHQYGQRMKILERIALEFNQLQYLVKKCPGVAFIAQQQSRIQVIHDQLETYLTETFDYVLHRIKAGPSSTSPLPADVSGDAETSANPAPHTGTVPARARFPIPHQCPRIARPLADLLVQCLRAYAALDRTPRISDGITTALVVPLLQDTLVAARTGGSTVGSLTDDSAINHYAFALKSTFQWMVNQVWPVHRLMAATLPGSSSLDLFRVTLWPRVIDALRTAWLPSLNNPGFPDRFHASLTLTEQFLEAVVEVFTRPVATPPSSPHPSAARAFLAGDERYRQFLKAWQTAPYFSIRAKELSGALDRDLDESINVQNLDSLWCPDPAAVIAELGQGTVTETPERDLPWLLTPSDTLWRTLIQCGDERVYLPMLAARFWKLHAQSIRKFTMWVDGVLDPYSKALVVHKIGPELTDDHSPAPLKGGASPMILSAGARSPSLIPNNREYRRILDDCPPLAPAAMQAIPSVLRNARLLDVLVYFMSDIYRITQGLTESLLPTRFEQMKRDDESLVVSGGGISSGHPKLTMTTVHPGLERLRLQAVYIARLLALLLANGASDILLQVRQVTSQFRHTNKPLPTAPSSYASRILNPVRDFLEAYQSSALIPDCLRVAIVRWTVEMVNRQFETILVELLETLKKTEESLLKLKRVKKMAVTTGSPGAESAVAAGSDETKIRRQISLDVQEYGRQLQTVKQYYDGIPAFRKLVQAVDSLS
ncbi:Conserved oligomeric Golgi complex subunit 2 [Dimargaris cristalligena]|uniref:Conserved oligomeric Golgi complex subunit 2 n=1 Tax=Dimargaris cristalligena TaxID=215637 RepID=A0A4P9ZTE9_9FUNG|nr:Conserved oligomeric Golgi complex subunit 2 [Dimargaris cristalligena]RKP36745.1 hypothetical protein BJ085DRAFT_38776 [Dimargaris cristalligena]|eukprot:RKP36745.1 hypothetical protein BJ085DRAFT_38776 [Dimargaris cristalligena]